MRHTTIYLSVTNDENDYIDSLKKEISSRERKKYSKKETIKHLLNLGIDVEKGMYLKLDPNVDKFVSQLQNMTYELNGQKVIIPKTKEQVYYMLIEKGIVHIRDD